jgi:Glyoxalase/Bleomycin resistance protein/Dioxygenase superfamily
MRVPSERRRVMQACWVVPDIDAAMKAWKQTMGIGEERRVTEQEFGFSGA